MINKSILMYYIIIGCFLTTQALQTVYMGATHIGYGDQIASKQQYQVSLNHYRDELMTKQTTAHSLKQASNFAKEHGFISGEPGSVITNNSILASL